MEKENWSQACKVEERELEEAEKEKKEISAREDMFWMKKQELGEESSEMEKQSHQRPHFVRYKHEMWLGENRDTHGEEDYIQ